MESRALALVGAASLAAAAYLLYRRRRVASSAALPTTGAHTVTRSLGTRSGVEVTVLGQGGASLGDLYLRISDADALATLQCAHACGVSFFDTSPWYGVGLSEARFGLALFRAPRDSFVFQTKVGRFLVPDPQGRNGAPTGWINGYHFTITFDYTAEALERQWQDSLQRTGLGRVDSLVIHDLEPMAAGGGDPAPGSGKDGLAGARAHLEVLRTSGLKTLRRLRSSGAVKAFGAGVNSDENGEDKAKKRAWNREYVDALLGFDESARGGERGLDFFLLANMYSLLNFEAHAEGILDKCLAAGVGVVVGGPYSSGILATGSRPKNGRPPMYNYEPANEEVLGRCRGIEAVCARHRVPLIAAALQFPLGHAAVSCVIPGGKSPSEVRSNVELMNVPIPAAFWSELKATGLIPSDAHTPLGRGAS